MLLTDPFQDVSNTETKLLCEDILAWPSFSKENHKSFLQTIATISEKDNICKICHPHD